MASCGKEWVGVMGRGLRSSSQCAVIIVAFGSERMGAHHGVYLSQADRQRRWW